MADRFERLFALGPAWLRDLAVTAGSTQLQRMRRSGVYDECRHRLERWRTLARDELFAIQRQRTGQLVARAIALSPYYRRKFGVAAPANFSDLPLLEKRELQEHIDEIVIGDKRTLEKAFTGGTTGAALTVYNSRANYQERFAIVDMFWAMHGFAIGSQRVAWFSGRCLLWDDDVRRRRFWRDNWLYRIRYYSTFHMSTANLGAYLDDLNEFRPEFLSGFPSAISEVARHAEQRGAGLSFRPRAIFVTSETLADEQRALMERVFRCKVRNQYSASEGAPFIVECPEGRLHYDLTSGVIEVLDDAGRPSREGEMIVTAFPTTETPIIRYRIGDAVTLSDEPCCPCGWDTPLVAAIHGRRADYLDVPGRGRIFNSQIGDCVKDVSTVLKFQVDLRDGRLLVDMVADRAAFEARDRATFLGKIAERMGDIPVDIRFLGDIPRAASGKHSLIKRRNHL